MSHSVVCYAQPDKAKSRRVLEAFAAGCGARMASTEARELLPGAAVFYGVRTGWLHLWEQAKREGRDWLFIDNSYFDVSRETYFRVTKNAIQHNGRGESDGKRFAALGIQLKPMRDDGENVIVCPSSAEFMRVVAGDPAWLDRMTRNLQNQYGQTRVIVRTKQDKRPLAADLERARLLVTWGSAAAVAALINGVPADCAPQCCAYGVTDRDKWVRVLADNQWTLDEIKNSVAWKALNK